MLSSLAFGVITLRMTGSILLGGAVQLLVFESIGSLTAEPMHPGGIICLLLTAIVALASAVGERPSRGLMGLIGATVAALALVKINVGAFAVASLALVCAVAYPTISRRGLLRPAVEIGFVATPLVLLASELGNGWARDYAFRVALAALAIVIVLRARDVSRRDAAELPWLVLGFLAAAAASLLAIVALGTSAGGLFDGLIGQPLRQADAFQIPLIQSKQYYFYDAVALSGAILYWYLAKHRRLEPSAPWRAAVSLAAIVIGTAMALAAISRSFPLEPAGLPGYQFGLLAFAWVALLPARADGGRTEFVRLLLPPLAVLQALHAYPVAGSQVLWATFLLIPVGALCVANGFRGLLEVLPDGLERRLAAAVASLAGLGVIALVVTGLMLPLLRDSRDNRDAAVPLDLPGADYVRVEPEQAAVLRSVSNAIAANCPAVLMLPGMNSFYFWAEQEPPTGFNATGWMTLFDDADQRRVIDDTRSIRGLCLLESQGLIANWTAGAPPQGPLVRYLSRGFRPIATFGAYRLLKRPGAGGSGA
jgi:hypothetical protein